MVSMFRAAACNEDISGGEKKWYYWHCLCSFEAFLRFCGYFSVYYKLTSISLFLLLSILPLCSQFFSISLYIFGLLCFPVVNWPKFE